VCVIVRACVSACVWVDGWKRETEKRGVPVLIYERERECVCVCMRVGERVCWCVRVRVCV